MKEKFSLAFIRLFLSLIFLAVFVPVSRSPAQASAPVGTIAYVVPNQPDGDQIHLIEPDGSGDRLLYRTNNPIPENLADILTLAWKPDASELAFAGAQESTCSLYETDIYAIRPDGKNYRRVTAPPSCEGRAGLPTGTVTVPIFNVTDTMGPFIIYFEGAPAATSIALPPGGSMDVTFYNVADFGPQDQYAVWMYGQYRTTYPGAKVNVVPGAAVRTGTLDIMDGFENWGFRWPTYLPDSSKIASVFGTQNLYAFDSNNPAPGWNGEEIPIDLELGASFLAWGPTAARANQFLYFGSWQDNQWNWRDSIFLGDANTAQAQELFDVDPNEDGNVILGLAWLPDGSGFVYSLKEFINETLDEGANIYAYSFATQQSRRLTNVPDGFTRQLTVSPDGKKILYEYQTSGDWIDQNPRFDLWMMNRDGSGQTLFVENGRSPAWSPQEVVLPVYHSVFLPFVRR